MDPHILKQVILEQNDIKRPPHFFKRSLFHKVKEFVNTPDIIVISGVRRCGKSTLMQEIRSQSAEQNYFINFEDDRLLQFDVTHFQLLFETFIELFGVQKTFYFDEIQNILGWERFVRRLYSQDYKIYITGSNAQLFSKELGTRLTGRYVQMEMYPYSFAEFVDYHLPHVAQKTVLTTEETGQLLNLFAQFRVLGGIPQFVEYQKPEYLQSLYESILYKDIITRHNITNDRPIRELVLFLAGNLGKEFSYNSVRKILSLAGATTVSEYCHYLEKSYLLFSINRYSDSLKKQLLSSKKCYFIDIALAKLVGFRPTEDRGRLLENIVFLELKRRGHEIYFHKEKKECDFLVRDKGSIVEAIQVCSTMEEASTRKREEEGLIDAMQAYSLDHGLILTEHQSPSSYQVDGYTIKVMPVWQWLRTTEAIGA